MTEVGIYDVFEDFAAFEGIPKSTINELLADGRLEVVQDGNHGSYYPKADEFADLGVPLITGANLSSGRINLDDCKFLKPDSAARLTKAKAVPGDVVLSHKGTIGQTAIVQDTGYPEIVLNPQLTLYRASQTKGLSNHYLRYLFDTSIFQAFLKSNSGISTIPTFGLNAQKRMRLPFPELGEQLEIVRPLVALDDKIELNRRMNETLEEMARGLFRDWFVDFGPTRRQMEGATDPAAIMGHAFPPKKAANLAPLFPAKLGDDGLPQGWSHGTATDHIDFNPKEPLKKGTVAPYSDMASLPTNGSLIAPPVDRDFKSGMRFRNGDALIARITPCLENGKAGFVDFLTEGAPVGWGSTEFFVLRSKPHVAPQFAYCLVRDPDFRKRAEQSMTGTSGRQRAQIEVLMSHELAVPDESVHSQFWAITAPFFEKIKVNGEENQTLAEMRDLLLPHLMSGKIRLKDTEAEV